MQDNDTKTSKKEYVFGEIKEYDLEKIESEVLQESVYLDVFAGSVIAFKNDISQINSAEALNKLAQLNAYTFKYKTTEFPEHDFPAGEQIGFMAQEVESQFPQLIKKDVNGNRFVNYVQLVPVMAETIKDLNARVETLEKLLASRI